MIPKTVSEFEEREAARFNGYNWSQWIELPRSERLNAVAYVRVSELVDRHRADAQRRASENAKPPAAKGAGRARRRYARR